jgi:hypothetical protein
VEEAVLTSPQSGADAAVVVAALGVGGPASGPRRGGRALNDGAAEESQTIAIGDHKVALQVTDRVVPDFQGRTLREVVAESASLGLQLDMQGRGVARRQWPPAGTPVAYGATVRVAFARVAPEVSAGP